MDQEGGVAAVVEQHVAAGLAVGAGFGPGEGPQRAVPVLLQRLALPGEDGDPLRVIRRPVEADGHRRGGVVLGREDVAACPANLGAERDQGLDQDGGLHRHVERSGDPRTPEGLGLGELLARRHQAGHLVLGEADLLAAELGQ